MSGRETISISATPAAVEVDVGHRRVLVVHQLARVLLDVDALDADALGAGLVLLVEQISTSPSPTSGW